MSSSSFQIMGDAEYDAYYNILPYRYAQRPFTQNKIGRPFERIISPSNANLVAVHTLQTSSSPRSIPLKSPTVPDTYKTEPCMHFTYKGHCSHGENCHFAHGEQDRKMKDLHPNYKTIDCISQRTIKYCKYGIRCTYRHPGDPGYGSSKSIFFSLLSKPK